MLEMKGRKAIALKSILTMVLILWSVPILVSSSGYSERDPVASPALVSTSGIDSDKVSASSGTNRFVIWTQQNANDLLSDIFFRRSTDNGATWKPVINLSKNAGASVDQQIGV
jgi:hypothetical protein